MILLTILAWTIMFTSIFMFVYRLHRDYYYEISRRNAIASGVIGSLLFLASLAYVIYF